MSRVFFPERPHNYDASQSEDYGEPVYLLDRVVSLSPQEAIDSFDAALIENKFDPEVDYICFTGKTLPLVLLGIAVYRRFKVIPALMFDARTSKYVERLIELEDLPHAQ